MPNSNVGKKRVIRAEGRDGYTWVTYRHPEQPWLCEEDRKRCNLGRNKHPRIGKNWNKAPTLQGLPVTPQGGRCELLKSLDSD